MSTAETDAVRRPNLLPRFLQPDPPVPPIDAEPQKIRQMVLGYRTSVLVWTTVGYAVFYFVRKNIATAMPAMQQELGITHASLGLFLTLHGVLYGISKFANGFVADRANGRKLLAIALLLSAAMNVCFGMSKTAMVMGIFWRRVSADRAAAHALVSAQGAGDQDVAVEHIAHDRLCVDPRAHRISGEIQLAIVLFRAVGDRGGDGDHAFTIFARYARIHRPAGSRRDRRGARRRR
jgi:Major Facilitator Superfamily